MRDFRFTNEHGADGAEEVVGFLERPRLWIPSTADYPDYLDWVAKVGTQLETEQKRAMVAQYGRNIVGAVVYQHHPLEPSTLQVKNISVSPTAQGRYVGSFLLRQAEIEGARYDFPGCDRVVVDTKTANLEMIGFAVHHGYELVAITDLYGLDAGNDAVLAKSLTVGAGLP